MSGTKRIKRNMEHALGITDRKKAEKIRRALEKAGRHSHATLPVTVPENKELVSEVNTTLSE